MTERLWHSADWGYLTTRTLMPIVDDLEAFLHEHRFSPTRPPLLPVGDGHVLRSANRDGGHQSLPEFLDRLQVTDEHPVRPVGERLELLAQPPHQVLARAARPGPTPLLAGRGEGVLPEELVLKVQRQVPDPALGVCSATLATSSWNLRRTLRKIILDNNRSPEYRPHVEQHDAVALASALMLRQSSNSSPAIPDRYDPRLLKSIDAPNAHRAAGPRQRRRP